MLDDLKYINQVDADGALAIAAQQDEQLSYEFETKFQPNLPEQVVLAGMGGSALAALVAQTWPGLNVPFEVSRGYSAPSYVSPETLFIASSYSGNTEETVSALAEAEAKQAQIVVMTSGGKLAEIAKAKKYPLLLIPAGYQPRHVLPYGLKALTTIFDAYKLTDGKALEVSSHAAWLKAQIAAWLPEVPTSTNRAKQIAQDCVGKSVVIYGGPLMAPVAYKWKISFNENAKHVAWSNQYSEFNHNEFIGWSKQPVDKPYTVIDIRSDLEHPQITKRFEISAKLLSGLRPDPIVVRPAGETLLQQLLSAIVLGDFVTLYTAILGGVNPTPVELIEKLKKELL
ncbi:MAG: bifunctional phosphoglucose/phosphomannose isomerase [Candidatus Saccharimonadales bacterium]